MTPMASPPIDAAGTVHMPAPIHAREDRTASLSGILLSVGGLTVIGLACKAAGFAEKLAVAHYMGTTQAADCYYAAFALLWTIVFVVLELVQPSLLPVYSELVQSRQTGQAYRLAQIVGVLLAAGILLLGAALAAWPTVAIQIVAPGFSAAARAEAAGLVRNMAPGTAILALTALTRTLLNAHRQFWWAALGDLVFRLTYLAVFVLGFVGWASSQVAAALAIGVSLALILHVAALRAKGVTFWHVTDVASTHTALLRVIQLATPLVVGIVFSHASQLIDSILASTLQVGRLSALTYAKKLTDTVVLLGPAALATVTFSHFAAWAATGALDQIQKQLVRCLRLVLVIGIPLTLLIIVLRHPIVHVLFERGRFDAASTQLTASALGGYAIGIVGLSLDGLLVSTFYAMRDMKTPVVVGVIGVICDILLAWFLMRRFGHIGIALSLSITKTAKVLVLWLILRRRFPTSMDVEEGLCS